MPPRIPDRDVRAQSLLLPVQEPYSAVGSAPAPRFMTKSLFSKSRRPVHSHPAGGKSHASHAHRRATTLRANPPSERSITLSARYRSGAGWQARPRVDVDNRYRAGSVRGSDLQSTAWKVCVR
jgi:hypothetical protein